MAKGKRGGQGQGTVDLTKIDTATLMDSRNKLADITKKSFQEMMKAKRNGDISKYNKIKSDRKSDTQKLKKIDDELARRRKGQQSIKITSQTIDYSNSVTQPTTTYERARKRRMKNFDAWFFGGRS